MPHDQAGEKYLVKVKNTLCARCSWQSTENRVPLHRENQRPAAADKYEVG